VAVSVVFYAGLYFEQYDLIHGCNIFHLIGCMIVKIALLNCYYITTLHAKSAKMWPVVTDVP